jgi:aminoglycoside phosphotransferase (APT) family kinase protein
MERVRGDCATDIANRSAQLGRRVCTGLAQVLAQLHSLSPASLGMSQPADPAACIAAYIQSWEELWLQRSQRHAPIVTSAFAWLHANVPQTIEHLALIHGDARPDNMLADDDGHVTALLDWEFIHVGDPAEDVLYACQFITPFIDIDTFMRAYRDAGGPNVDSNRAQFYEIWRNVRNLVCLDLSWSAFISGDYPAYVTGAPTLLFRRALIADLARSLQAVGL